MQKLQLSHVVLYAKKWYKQYSTHTNATRRNVFDDLKIILSKTYYFADDAVGYECRDRIVSLLMTDFARLNIRQTNISHFYEEIKDCNVWKYGYTTKTNCHYYGRRADKYPEYDYDTAVCYYILSTLCHLEKDTHWTPVAPDPTILPIRNGITQATINRHFNKSEV